MRLTAVVVLAVVLVAGQRAVVRMESVQAAPGVRPPAFAGQFYPSDPAVLRAALEGFMRDALPARPLRPVAVVVPHAGYIYSGQIAADAYRQAASVPVDTVVILGTNHTSGTFRRVSVYDGEGYRTPLGVARVDRDLAAALVKEGGGIFDGSMHAREHSVEVQVPFVQHVFPGAAIVPVVVGAPDPESCRRFGRAIAALAAGRRVLIVASSDLSHYPEQRVAADVDRRTLEAIAGMKVDALADMEARAASSGARGVSTCACGEGPIRVAIEAARALGALRGTVVSYANSGDSAVGDPQRVVGYGAVAFSGGEAGADLRAIQPVAADSAGALDAADKKVLLRLVRETITRFLRTETVPLPRGGSARLLRESGAFVTLKSHGQLRGCIGRIEPAGPLIQLVGTLALDSAFRDSRFKPVGAGELKDIDIEVSVLTPLASVPGPDAIRPGRDGVVLRVGDRSAVFLPQVATEQGWSRTELLDNLAQKAGLAPGAWRDRRAALLTFRADVFDESSLK
jgi:AmmeMemoRadiSam system protein B/AmmeMemoRadiSam system protein A